MIDGEAPVFITDEDVIREFRRRRIPMSKRVLTDWRQRGYLPPLKSRGRGRGEGRSYYWNDPAVVRQALLVDEILSAGFRREDIKLVLWLMGYQVPIKSIRAILKSNVLALQKRLTGGSTKAGEIEDHISHFIYQYNHIVERYPQLNLPTYKDADAAEVVLNIFANPGYDLETAPLNALTNKNSDAAPALQSNEAGDLTPPWEFIRRHFSLEQLQLALTRSSESVFYQAQTDFLLVSSVVGKIFEASSESATLAPYRFNAIYTFGSIIIIADLCLRQSEWAEKVDTYLPMSRYYIERGVGLANTELSSTEPSKESQTNSMLTARALQEIYPSDFETLVTLYLRHRDPELAAVIRTGSNEFQKPIKCPVDGILYLPAPPPQCVAIASTTTEQRDLRRKWLGGRKGKSNEPGDISKADNEFSAWRGTKETPHLRLYLATNRFLKNDTVLYRDTIAQGQLRGIQIEVVEASQLVDFLDFDPEGQFLRQVFLNIRAGRLSETLLRSIANKSLQHHARSFSVLLAPEHEIKRESLQSLLQTIAAQNRRLIAIRGESGSGKSTFVRHLAWEIISRGGVAMWLPADEITSHDSLASVLHSLLLKFEPTLDSAAGNKLMELSGRFRGGLTLVVDDVNRVPAPERTLEALRVLAAEASQVDVPIRFVVPVWKNQLPEDSGNARTSESIWSVFDLGQFSQSEQQGLVKTFSSSNEPAMISIAALLGGDPFLCGITLPTLSNFSREKSFVDVLKATFESVVTSAAEAAANLRRMQATAVEFCSVVDDFIELCLDLDDPEPLWMAARERLNERKSSLLYLLAETNQLIHFASIGPTEKLVWKHDRLRDAFVGRWLAKNVVPKVIASDAGEDARLVNPALAEAWAMSFVFVPAELRIQLIDLLVTHQPLAMVDLLKIRACGLSETNAALVCKLKAFLNTTSFPDPVPDRKSGIIWSLGKTDSEDVLEVTEGLQGRSWHISAARFRNGDVDAGLDLMSRFFPEDNFRDLEECVEAFAKRRASDRATVAAELEDVPNDGDSVARLLTLCGYLGWSELVSNSWRAWKSLSRAQRLTLLPPVVWMLSRCGDERAQEFLIEALEMTQEIGANEPGDRMSKLGPEFIRPIRRSFRWPITPHSANTWAELGKNRPELRSSVAYMLRHIDQPTTLETHIRMAALDADRLVDAFEHAETNSLDDSKRSVFRSSIPVRPESRSRVWEIIKTDNDQEVRKWAFKFYKRSPTAKDLSELQKIPESDPLFDDVLRLRLRLRDETAAQAYIRRMTEQPAKWCHWVHFLYSIPTVSEAFFRNVGIALKDEIAYVYLENLPKVLPVDGADRLITEKGDLLKTYPRMWPALWCIGTPTTLAYVQERISEASHEELEHFFLMEIGDRMRTESAFDALLPVLDKFPRRELSFLADIAVNSGFATWARANLAGRLNGEHARHWLTEDDAIQIFNDAANRVGTGGEPIEKTPYLYQLEHERRNTFDVREMVRSWLGQTPTTEQLIVGAMVMAQAGRGEDATWWRSVAIPASSEIATRVWRNTNYLLQRRRWQKNA